MITVAGIIAVLSLLFTDAGKMAIGSLLVFIGESTIGLLIVAYFLGVFG